MRCCQFLELLGIYLRHTVYQVKRSDHAIKIPPIYLSRPLLDCIDGTTFASSFSYRIISPGELSVEIKRVARALG